MMVMMLTEKDNKLFNFLFKILYFNVFGLFMIVHLNAFLVSQVLVNFVLFGWFISLLFQLSG